MMAVASIAKRASDLTAVPVSHTEDTNYFACMLDPLADGVSFTMVVEIFEPGGKTPPNSHTVAEEVFFVMAGTGRAFADGVSRDVGPGRRSRAATGGRACRGKYRARQAVLPDDDDAERGVRGTDPRGNPDGTD